MIPRLIEFAVVSISVCSAGYLLVQFVRWISRLFKSHNEHNDRQEGPPDLFGGF